jgi:hypothetical protein
MEAKIIMVHKKALSFIFILVAVLILGVMSPRTADSKIITNVPADISDEELKALVIDDFENVQVGDQGWTIISDPKKFESQVTETKLKMKDPVPTLQMKPIDGYPNDMAVEEWSLTGLGKEKKKCLAVFFQFRYPGPNSVHILCPPEVEWKDKTPVLTYNPSTRKDEQERGIQLPGRAKAISIWVHGRGNPYYLEAWLKDYLGNTHVLKFGSVNFVGWKPLKVEIPIGVPQSYESYPQTRVTKITRFVLRAEENASYQELTAETFFSFDQLKVLTDVFEVNFDGRDLHKAFKGEQKKETGQTAK